MSMKAENLLNKTTSLFFGQKYKTFLSIIFGLIGFIGTFFTIRFDFKPIKIDIVWSMIFPMIVTIAWGKKYGIISLVFGLNVFYPFYLWTNNGWDCLVFFFCTIIWVVLHGYASEKRRNSTSKIYNIYFVELVCLFVYILFELTLFPFLLKYNPPFWYKHAITDISNEALRFIFIKKIVVEFFIIAACDVLLLLPKVKKIFMLKVESKSKHNTKILLNIMGIGGAFFLSAILIEYLLLTKNCTCELIKIVQARDALYLIILMIFCLVSSGIAIRYFEKHQESEEITIEAQRKQIESEQKYKLLFEKMTNAMVIYELVYNESNEPVDVMIIDANPSVEKELGIKLSDIIGNLYSIAMGKNNPNIRKYKHLLENDISFQCEAYDKQIYKHVLMNAFKLNEKHVAVIFNNITERKNAENEVLKLNQELEQRIEERTLELQSTLSELEAFNSTVSHDLKAPLRAIQGYSRIIKEDYEEKLKIECMEMVNKIREICTDMIKLIDKLLEYSTTSKLSVHKEEINIKEIFISVFNELVLTCVKRRIQLDFETDIPFVNADAILIRQVIYNILCNAIKFTKNTAIATITIGYIEQDKEHVFYIKDNGVGFDMEYQYKLFEMFQRLHTVEEYEGHGIGLAAVRKIVQKHGGKTWIKGEIDVGAEIYFTLPIE